jgi:DNA helicase-2/ATP-dependent DNA helicase PcrA
VVDEYQDVSPLQQLLLDQWLGDRDELCVVGDPSQTIFSFTGATPRYLLEFRARFPDAREVRLVRDYRSTPQVVHLANEVLRRGRVAGALQLVAMRPAGPAIGFTQYDDDEAEAAGVAGKVKRLIATGIRPSQIAVLYRVNAQSEAFETAFSQAGIGYQVRGGERFFQRAEVRDAIRLLRGAARSPDASQAMPALVRDVLSAVGWQPTPPADRGATRERWDSMQALAGLGDDLAELAQREGRTATIADFVAELQERASAQHAPTVEGVTLASLHAAKGLEWDAVFLAGLSEGFMPITHAETDAELAEERRLLYVGVTRARIHLDVSYARSRAPGGRATRKRTRFLDGLWPEELRGRSAARGTVVERAGHGGGSRASSALTGEGDVDVFEALRSWRLGVAKETSKPAFTILTDAVLVAIAHERPADTRQLARINGIGPAKIDRYGETVLAIVAAAQ